MDDLKMEREKMLSYFRGRSRSEASETVVIKVDATVNLKVWVLITLGHHGRVKNNLLMNMDRLEA